ncbi:MAG: dihydrodipicolinate reductase [Alphaproteobacteria bacterium HGW-Alphaproteobacteria-2]|nr:MAG: dihydrodipicolinate reductase [Alphaproteobacteria bacterium HGW-Alphaproteobacteria-2]
MRLVEGRTLSTLGVKLEVTPEGRISGRAWGRDVTGTWRWTDGYFCREMTFGEKPVEADCQVVRQEGEALRFIAERGAGQQARLALR